MGKGVAWEQRQLVGEKIRPHGARPWQPGGTARGAPFRSGPVWPEAAN